jgi:hypothetical protein
MRTIDQRTGIWPLSLEQIEATVASHLGPGRVPGNEQVPCFSPSDVDVHSEPPWRLEHHKDWEIL